VISSGQAQILTGFSLLLVILATAAERFEVSLVREKEATPIQQRCIDSRQVIMVSSSLYLKNNLMYDFLL